MKWHRARSSNAWAGVVLALLFGGALLLAPAGGLELVPATQPFLPPSLAHPFGTDDLGRDLLLATAQGTRTSLIVGFGVAALAVGLGVIVGLAAGFGPPILDEALMRSADVVASLPTLLLAILVSSIFGGSIGGLVLVLGLTRWPLIARLVRIETAALRHREFIRAAHALGLKPLAIVWRHILPQAVVVALSASGILFGGALVSEAALAFVGLGDPSVTSLGELASHGFSFVHHAPWMWVVPVIVISLAAGLFAVMTEPRALALQE